MTMLQASINRVAQAVYAGCAALGLAACGGGAGNPFDNPATVVNPLVVAGQHLSFAYFQKCIAPIFTAQLQIQIGSVTSTNTCEIGRASCRERVLASV